MTRYDLAQQRLRRSPRTGRVTSEAGLIRPTSGTLERYVPHCGANTAELAV